MANEDQEVVEGAGEQPSKPVSKPIDDPNHKLLVELGGKYESLEKELRGLQGRQDKSESAFKKQLAEYQSLVKGGYEPDDAVAEMESRSQRSNDLLDLRRMVEDLAKRVDSRGTTGSVKQEVVDAFSQFDLPANDPRVILAMQRHYDSTDAAELAAFKLAKELGQSPNPSPAQDPSPADGKDGAIDVAALAAESEELMKNPSKNVDRIAEIHDTLRKAGALA